MAADADPTVIFLHIGKTGGTTLRKILRRHYPDSQVLVVRAVRRPREETIAEFAELPEARRAAPRLIVGHTVFGLHEHVPRPSTYITILREPRSLVISQYAYVRRTPGHRHHDAASRMTMAEYIESGLAQEMNNSQTRALAGAVETAYGENPPELLDMARRNVEQYFATVALTERFDESLVALARQFGWSKLSYVKAKVGGRREPVPPDTLELIDRMNQLDRSLYDWAAGRLDEQIAADEGFDGRMARFRRRNMLYRPWATVTYTVPKKIQQRAAGAR
jgi:hypothetical protein